MTPVVSLSYTRGQIHLCGDHKIYKIVWKFLIAWLAELIILANNGFNLQSN